MSLYFDNEKLFDAEGHLTDAGLYALKDGTLDDLGALEAAEHLSFCDYCLLRYTALIEAAPEAMKQPMRDLIPQVQSLMRLRSFRIMTNRYVSAAAAVVLGFVLWGAVSTFGLPDVSALTAQQPTTPHERFGTKSVSYTHLRAHETRSNLVCRLLLEKIFFNDTATTEIYTRKIVGSVRCV